MSEEKQVENQQEENLSLAKGLALTEINGWPDQPEKIDMSKETQEEKSESKVEEKVELTPDQRIEVLQEISVLTSAVGMIHYYPHFDNGNKGKQKRRITKSTPLNLLDYQQMDQIKTRIVQLINLL